jgi:hypothetical protein
VEELSHAVDQVEQAGVRVLEPVAYRDTPERIENGQVELASHVDWLGVARAGELAQEGCELLYLLLDHLLHA